MNLTSRLLASAALLLGALLLAAPLAQAQKIKGRKTKAFTIAARKVASGKRVKARRGGPTQIDFEKEKMRKQALAENEKLQSERRRRTIELIVRLLKSRTYQLSHMRTMRSQQLMRKANFEYLEARYQNYLSYQKFEKAQEAYDEGRTKVQPKPPKPQFSQAIGTFQQLLKEDPGCRKCDEARYRLGYCMNQAGTSSKAAGVLAELVRYHPRSRFVASAYLLMGEIWFDANKFIAAAGNYLQVLRRFPTANMAGYAEYKYAWSVFQNGRFNEGISSLKKVVKHRGVQLKTQALADLVMFFSEIPGGWIQAKQYYTSVGGLKMALSYVWRLARFLDAKDKNVDCLAVIDWLLKKNNSSAKAIAYHQLQVDILVRMKIPAKLDEGLRKIVNFYAPGSPWVKANGANKAVVKGGQSLAEKAMAYVATYYHREGTQGGKEESLERAVTLYKGFIERFSYSKQITNMRFFLAELQKGFKRYDEAAVLYAEVVKDPKPKFREDAAFQRVWCLSEMLKSKGLDRAVPASLGKKAIPKTSLAPLEKRFIAGSDDFARLYAKSKDTPAVLFKAARTFYDHGMLGKSGKRFVTLVRTHPKHKFAALAGAMALNAYSRLKDWPNVVEIASYLIKHRNYKHYKRNKLRAIIASAGIKAAGMLEKAGKFEPAAKAMCAVYDQFPRDKEAPRALFNCAVLFERAKKVELAIAKYKKVRKIAKKSEFAAKSTFVLGVLSENRAKFEEAARYYGEMAKMKKIKRTPDALYNASVMHEALGNYREAEKIRRGYLKLYPGRKDAARAYFSIGKLLEQQKKWKKAVSFYLDFVKKKQKLIKERPILAVAAWMRAGRCVRYGKLRNQKRALLYFKNAVKEFIRRKMRPGSIAAAYAGWARYHLAEVMFDKFEAAKVNEKKVRKMVAQIKAKAALIAKTQKMYMSVLSFKALVWSTAAVYKIGLLYARMLETIKGLENPIPEGKPGHDEYVEALERIMQPLEDKALSAFRRAVKVAHDLRTYNRFTSQAATQLVQRDPDSFPNPGRQVLRRGHRQQLRFAAPVLSLGGLQ